MKHLMICWYECGLCAPFSDILQYPRAALLCLHSWQPARQAGIAAPYSDPVNHTQGDQTTCNFTF